jgi:hypothetical protein
MSYGTDVMKKMGRAWFFDGRKDRMRKKLLFLPDPI